MNRHEPGSRAQRVSAGDLASIEALEIAAATCQLCRLCRDRTQVVTGSGPADADVLVIAEAPGYHEDRSGQLLAGRPGELFDTLLADAGLVREEVFLTSVVKCRPPGGRTPFPDEVDACEGWLFREIALVQPKIVVTLGSLALRLVTGRHELIRDAHGKMIHTNLQGRDLVVWPLYHPAAALHVTSLVTQLRADARALGVLLQGARAETGSRPRPSQSPVDPEVPATASKPATEPSAKPAGTEPEPPVDTQLTMDM
ncbi:MAG: uracil-DNA glycosylase [Gaiellales bacterium]